MTTASEALQDPGPRSASEDRDRSQSRYDLLSGIGCYVLWGGLSGCTYSEGVSWGKFVPPEEGGRFCEVIEDATVSWPLVVKAVMERLDKKAGPKKTIPSGETKIRDCASPSALMGFARPASTGCT